MKKPILILTAAVSGVALGVAATFWNDLERERVRANSLAERVAILEPVERGDSSQASNNPTSEARPALTLDVAEPPQEVVEQPKPMLTGSPAALQRVERLQAALVEHTPLQHYQAQALVAAIDRLQPNGRTDAGSTNELRQAAADILFESQFETFVELTERDAK